MAANWTNRVNVGIIWISSFDEEAMMTRPIALAKEPSISNITGYVLFRRHLMAS
jgi:hypothetical protein